MASSFAALFAAANVGAVRRGRDLFQQVYAHQGKLSIGRLEGGGRQPELAARVLERGGGTIGEEEVAERGQAHVWRVSKVQCLPCFHTYSSNYEPIYRG